MELPELVDHPANRLIASQNLDITISNAAAVPAKAVGNAIVTLGRHDHPYVMESPQTAVSFPLRGVSTVTCTSASGEFRYVAAPGGFSILRGWGEYGVRVADLVESLTLTVEPRRIAEIVEQEFDAPGEAVELLPVWQDQDADLVALGQEFAAFLRSPRRRSRLYSEMLWIQILMQLLWRHSSLPRPQPSESERLSDVRIRRVIDFMQGTLAEDVGLEDLARVAGLSPNYFLNAFRKPTGKTPHRYRTELRINRARELLHDPTLPIIQAALAVGYTSQSHLTSVFRRVVGVTPAAYRAQVLRLDERT